jgi:hypothetical protein
VTLAIQLFGCAGAVLIIAMLVRGDTSRPAIAASTAVVATIVVALIGLEKLWPNVVQQRQGAKGQQGLTAADAAKAGGRAQNINADFVEWAVTKIPNPADRWFLVPAEPTVQQWVSYRMLPRLTSVQPAKGTWLVFYNTTVRKAGYRRSQLSDLETFQPGFAIARLERPGGAK